MCESNFWIFVIALTKKGESRRLSRPTARGRKISCFQFVFFAVITAGISRLPVVKFNRSDGKIEKGVVVFFWAPRRHLDWACVDLRSPAQ